MNLANMKEVTKEKIITENYTVYEAIDGTEFLNRNECLQYENTAKVVLRAKLKKYIVNDQYSPFTLFNDGYDENKVLAIEVPTEEAKDIILMNYCIDNPYIAENEERKGTLIQLLDKALKTDDIVLFGLNDENYLYLIDARNNIIDRLTNLYPNA